MMFTSQHKENTKFNNTLATKTYRIRCSGHIIGGSKDGRWVLHCKIVGQRIHNLKMQNASTLWFSGAKKDWNASAYGHIYPVWTTDSYELVFSHDCSYIRMFAGRYFLLPSRNLIFLHEIIWVSVKFGSISVASYGFGSYWSTFAISVFISSLLSQSSSLYRALILLQNRKQPCTYYKFITK